ncbi:17721_t:CDS:2, partial [Dentiscutata erythropus]
NLNVKMKLLDEIKTVFKDNLTRPITLDDLDKLRYCEAIIKETSGIRPAVPLVSRYTNHADEIAGYPWPSTTDILFIIFYEPQEIKNHKFSFSMFGGGLRVDIELVDMNAPLKIRNSTSIICENLDIRIIHKQPTN